ncbi:LIM domain-binding protein 3-like isoform x4 [Plakobranchus ocellatus]|uniref:LIM domain-binding protein 3-like isoform x4 n=1 Tax=Plakobranchus ocellatus TaxID=259542 RepID=A0AAV3YG45_9GAST|nr:LIM domain-binding protein 3-like isoform x4 [Plakobranchus ocellatus]
MLCCALSRVQTTLDNITLSPRTPDALSAAPVYQPYTPPQQQPHQPQPSQLSPQYRPQQVYTPTSLLLEQQRLQQDQPQQAADEGEDPIPPVWERRRMFQQIDSASKSPVRTPVTHPKPKVPKPQPFSPSTPSKYSTFGQDYGNRAPQQSQAVWRPSQPSPGGYHQPYSHGKEPPALVHSAPPPWKRPEDDVDDSTPAWRSTLKSAQGVKPWERDIEYQHQQFQDSAPRSVPYNPAPAPGPLSPNQAPGTPGDGPKVVHLQYNSPMSLYSSQNVAETYASHAKALTPTGGEANKPVQSYQAGDRDWSQSAVLQFLNQEAKRGGAPPVAPKPQQNMVHHSPAPQHNQHQMQQPYYNDASVGASDF